MKIARSVLLVGGFSVLSACQIGLAANPQPQPIQSESPVSSPAPTPQASPEVSASSDVLPTPVSTPSAVEGLQRYVNNVYCEEIEESLGSQQLDSIQDVVVSPDGETVYFTYSRERFVRDPLKNRVLFHSGNPWAGNSIFSHQFIQRIDKGGRILPLQIGSEFPLSCHLSAEIEKDSQGRLILNRPLFLEAGRGVPTRGHLFYRWTPGQDTLTPWHQVNFDEPNPSPSAIPNAVNLSEVRMASNRENSVFYTLIGEPAYARYHLIQALSSAETPQNLLSIDDGNNLDPFSLLPNGELIYGYKRVEPPYPAHYAPGITQNGQPVTPLDQFKSLLTDEPPFQVSASRVSPDGKLVYISDGKQSHSIWKIDLATRQATRLAGNGTAGYRDGMGEQAQLNQPGELDLDVAGNLYVADVGNIAIRKITPTGEVSTLFKRPTL